jgi:ectoine hydroxylase-related dioxygenase (phytanoyl-CoA dioxygenase family)
MLYELFSLIDDAGVGSLMTEFLGERPYLAANKCTLRRVPRTQANGGWHQDGAFLGNAVGAFNLWLALSPCGRESPSLDVVAHRFDSVLDPGEDAEFKWSLSHDAVLEAAAAADANVVRPDFEAGDALIFDHVLVHRTAAADTPVRDRYAIESWFFAPTAYPPGQLPLVY